MRSEPSRSSASSAVQLLCQTKQKKPPREIERGEEAVARKPRACHCILPRGSVVARAEVVSWLRAFARLPDHSRDQWLCERNLECPLQWRGRTGIAPVSVSPTRVEL